MSVQPINFAEAVQNDPDLPSPFDPITQAKPRMFLIALAESGNIVQAAKVAGCSRAAVYHWKRTDSNFLRCFNVAWELGIEALEAQVHERATRPSFPSDPLAMFLLKGGNPARYGDRSRMELTGANGGPVKLDYSKLTDDQLAQLEQLVALATAKPAEIEPSTIDVASTEVPQSESSPVTSDNQTQPTESTGT